MEKSECSSVDCMQENSDWRCKMCSRQLCSNRESMNRSHTFHKSIGFLLYCAIFCALLHSSRGQNFEINTDNLGTYAAADGSPAGSKVSLMWGIADTSATVGKMFSYAIPSDAFKGTVLKYKVTEAGKESLPSWLMFDQQTNSLKGIATPDDMKHHYIEVIAHGRRQSQAKDVFSITVSAEPPTHHVPSPVSPSNGKPQVVKCKTEQPETTVTIVMDTDMTSLPVPDRLATIQKLTDYLKLSSEMMKLLPLGSRPMFDSSALVAGPGDTKSPKTPGMTMSWLVGCGKVEEDHMKILHKIESSSKDGTMKSKVGHPVIGWHVTYTANHLKPRRKRAIRATATPVQTPSPPTDVPVDVTTDTDIKPTKSTEPLSRSVPSMESPSFTMTDMIKPTKTVDVMPSASPTPEPTTDAMMTKTVTPMPKTTTMKPKITTGAILPSEGTPKVTPKDTNTQILPTRTFVVTDAPTSVVTPTPKPVTKQPTEKPVTKEPVTKKPTTEKPHIHCPDDNQPRRPVVKGSMETMLFMAGQETVYSVPNDLFLDCETPEGTFGLRLNLLNGTSEELPRNYWLSVVKRSEDWKLVGFPLPKDIGATSLTLAALNSYHIAPAFYTIKIGVVRGQKVKGEPSHKVSMTFDGNYKKFGPRKMKEMTKKVAGVFSDKKDASDQITVLEVSAGSIVYSWTNNTLPTDRCPAKHIRQMMKKLVNEDGTLKKSAQRKLEPFVLSEVSSVPSGSCAQDPNFPLVDTRKLPPSRTVPPDTTDRPKPPPPKPPTPSSEPEPEPTTTLKDPAAQGTSDDEIWITTVVPAVVIVAILLIALIVACILYRKQRKGKMSLEDKHTFVNKGAPVIFPDEYDEKPNESTRPLILDEEKPPMPPPEYTRASSESSRSSDHKREDVEEHEMEESDMTSPLYKPPPPVQSSTNNKQPRPHVQPAYKNPTPYVPP